MTLKEYISLITNETFLLRTDIIGIFNLKTNLPYLLEYLKNLI